MKEIIFNQSFEGCFVSDVCKLITRRYLDEFQIKYETIMNQSINIFFLPHTHIDICVCNSVICLRVCPCVCPPVIFKRARGRHENGRTNGQSGHNGAFYRTKKIPLISNNLKVIMNFKRATTAQHSQYPISADDKKKFNFTICFPLAYRIRKSYRREKYNDDRMLKLIISVRVFMLLLIISLLAPDRTNYRLELNETIFYFFLARVEDKVLVEHKKLQNKFSMEKNFLLN